VIVPISVVSVQRKAKRISKRSPSSSSGHPLLIRETPSLLEDAQDLLLQLVRQPHGRTISLSRRLLGNVLVAGTAAARVVVGIVVMAGPDSRLGDQVLVQAGDLLDARVADVGCACGEEREWSALWSVS
jgi:hypothetical protein